MVAMVMSVAVACRVGGACGALHDDVGGPSRARRRRPRAAGAADGAAAAVGPRAAAGGAVNLGNRKLESERTDGGAFVASLGVEYAQNTTKRKHNYKTNYNTHTAFLGKNTIYFTTNF
jgi:hypothetical protein